jgi:hypothetical protein
VLIDLKISDVEHHHIVLPGSEGINHASYVVLLKFREILAKVLQRSIGCAISENQKYKTISSCFRFPKTALNMIIGSTCRSFMFSPEGSNCRE